jgi:hypothetical protein
MRPLPEAPRLCFIAGQHKRILNGLNAEARVSRRIETRPAPRSVLCAVSSMRDYQYCYARQVAPDIIQDLNTLCRVSRGAIIASQTTRPCIQDDKPQGRDTSGACRNVPLYLRVAYSCSILKYLTPIIINSCFKQAIQLSGIT